MMQQMNSTGGQERVHAATPSVSSSLSGGGSGSTLSHSPLAFFGSTSGVSYCMPAPLNLQPQQVHQAFAFPMPVCTMAMPFSQPFHTSQLLHFPGAAQYVGAAAAVPSMANGQVPGFIAPSAHPAVVAVDQVQPAAAPPSHGQQKQQCSPLTQQQKPPPGQRRPPQQQQSQLPQQQPHTQPTEKPPAAPTKQQPRHQRPGTNLQQPPQTLQGTAGNAAAEPASKSRRPRPSKYQTEAQHKRSQQAQIEIRRLEQQVGRAKREHAAMQQERAALQHKHCVLKTLDSFGRCIRLLVDELTQSVAAPQKPAEGVRPQPERSRQCTLHLAQKGLPAPEALEYLRRMTLDEAVHFYSSAVSQVRHLLDQLHNGPNPAAARHQLDEIFTVDDKFNTFCYLQVLNPTVYAQLTQAKLDPASPVDRQDPSHWRSVLASMVLSEEQQAQLILLLQLHAQQADQIIERKRDVLHRLASELTSDMLGMKLEESNDHGHGHGHGSTPGLLSPSSSSSITLSSHPDEAGEDGGVGEGPQESQDGSVAPLGSKDELDGLMQLEYWLKFDFTGCVRKLLPPQQQALCMVHSWPFYPDARQLEAAMRQKAGKLWEQLAELQRDPCPGVELAGVPAALES